MSNVIDIAGKVISDQVRSNPQRANQLLSTIYSGVNLADHLQGFVTKGYTSVEQPYVGYISGVIARGMRNPKKCALVNIFLPHELTAAFDIVPIFPEGIAVYLANTACSSVFAAIAEENGIPESFCSYHKVMLGLVESGVLQAPAIIANTTLACDANQLSFRRIAQKTGAPHAVIDVPYGTDEDAIAFVEEEIYKTIAMMEDALHQHLDPDKLRKATARSQKLFAAMQRYWNIRKDKVLPSTMTGVLCNMIATHCLSCAPQSLRFIEGMDKLVRQAPRFNQRVSDSASIASVSSAVSSASVSPTASATSTASAVLSVSTASARANAPYVPRIFWMHTLPNWQMSLRDFFDGAPQAEIVGVDFMFDSPLDADPTDPVGSMARRIVNNVNGGNGQLRIESAIRMAKETHANGVIIFGHWGCKQTLGLSQLAKEAFEAEGMSTLVLDGDGCDPRNVADGQMVTRIGAFIEQLGGGQ